MQPLSVLLLSLSDTHVKLIGSTLPFLMRAFFEQKGEGVGGVLNWILLGMCFAPDMPDSGKVALNSDAASPSATPEPEQLPEEGERGETPEVQGRNYNNVIHKLIS